MEELHRYFTKRIIYLGVLVVLIVLSIERIFLPMLVSYLTVDHVLTQGLEYLTSKPSIVAMLAVGVYFIRVKLWKFEKKKLDFSGDWAGTTKFQEVVIGKPIDPFSTTYNVKIKQDCLSIKILPSTGESFVNWGSLALDLSDEDTLRYAYWVIYTDRDKFPPKAIGYEEMKVTKRDNKKRPVELTGNFYHCAQGQEPVYNGEIKFVKK